MNIPSTLIARGRVSSTVWLAWCFLPLTIQAFDMYSVCTRMVEKKKRRCGGARLYHWYYSIGNVGLLASSWCAFRCGAAPVQSVGGVHSSAVLTVFAITTGLSMVQLYSTEFWQRCKNSLFAYGIAIPTALLLSFERKC